MDTHKPSSNPSSSGTSTGSTPGSSASPGMDSMRGALDEAKRHVDTLTEDVKGTAADLAAQAREAASQAASEGARKASRFAESQKDLAADQIAKVSEAAHAAADRLNDTSPQMARYAHEMASGIDRFAGRIRERSIGDLVRQASDYARRDPAVFMAGTVLVGFMLTRFLKSGAERAERERDDRMGQGAGRGRDFGGREYAGGFDRGYGDDRERRMGTGGPDRFRNATQGAGSMPAPAGSGRSFDPTPRFDEREPIPGQGGPGGMRPSSPGLGSSGLGSSGMGTSGMGSSGDNVRPDLTRGGSHG